MPVPDTASATGSASAASTEKLVVLLAVCRCEIFFHGGVLIQFKLRVKFSSKVKDAGTSSILVHSLVQLPHRQAPTRYL